MHLQPAPAWSPDCKSSVAARRARTCKMGTTALFSMPLQLQGNVNMRAVAAKICKPKGGQEKNELLRTDDRDTFS